jgi:small GTP-binding protein
MQASSTDRFLLLTAPGTAALASIRVAGPSANNFFARRFSRPLKLNHVVHGDLRDDAGVIDDPVVAQHDHYIDITLHGGPWVVRAATELLQRDGFTQISAEDDPLLAAGTESIFHAEIVNAIPLAATELSLRALLAQQNAWPAHIASVPCTGGVNRIINDTALLHLLHPPTVAIVGVPNAGKSTLANALFGTKRSIVSDIPGTTRDWVGETANIDGLRLTLLDTPGLRSSADAIEQTAIAQSASPIESADLVIVLIDGAQPRTAQHDILARYENRPHLQIINKADALDAHWRLSPQLKISARNDASLGSLRQAILQVFGCHNLDLAQPRCWTRRQHDILLAALDNPARVADIVGPAS